MENDPLLHGMQCYKALYSAVVVERGGTLGELYWDAACCIMLDSLLRGSDH